MEKTAEQAESAHLRRDPGATYRCINKLSRGAMAPRFALHGRRGPCMTEEDEIEAREDALVKIFDARPIPVDDRRPCQGSCLPVDVVPQPVNEVEKGLMLRKKRLKPRLQVLHLCATCRFHSR